MRPIHFLPAASILVGAAVAQTAPSVALINEIRIDMPGGDNDEYAELIVAPIGASLSGMSYIVIGDGTGGSGTIESASDLSTLTVGMSGLVLLGESSMTIAMPDLITTLGFENSDNVTHVLVQDFTGAIGDDLDTDDDGILDVTPWSMVWDAISLVEDPMGGDQFYASTLTTPNSSAVDVGPDGIFVPAHVYRCITSFTDVRIGNFSLDVPSGGLDSPGELNSICVFETTPFCDPGAANSFSMAGGLLSMETSGRIAANNSTIVATDVPDFFGVFVQATGAGAAVMSGIGGNICVNQDITRMNQIVAASANRAELALDFTNPMLVESITTAGQTLYYQYFHRDTVFPGGGNWTNGLAVTWAP